MAEQAPKYDPNNHPSWVDQHDAERAAKKAILDKEARMKAIETDLREKYARNDREREERIAILPKWLRDFMFNSVNALPAAIAALVASTATIDEKETRYSNSRHTEQRTLSPQEIMEMKPISPDFQIVTTSKSESAISEPTGTFDELAGVMVNPQTKLLLQLPTSTIETGIVLNFERMLVQNLKYSVYEFEARKNAYKKTQVKSEFDELVETALKGLNLYTSESDALFNKVGFDAHVEIFRENRDATEQVTSIAELREKLHVAITKTFDSLDADQGKKWSELMTANELTPEDISAIRGLLKDKISADLLLQELKTNIFGADLPGTHDQLLEFILKHKGGLSFLLALPPSKENLYGSRVLPIIGLNDEVPTDPRKLQNLEWLVDTHLKDTIKWLVDARKGSARTAKPESSTPVTPPLAENDTIPLE